MAGEAERRAPSSYEARLRRAIEPASAADRDELLEFRRRMYGAQSAYADPAWVRWMYDEARANSLWLWRHGGRVEGQQGAIRTELRVGGEPLTLAWALDLMVSPEHRKRGVGAVLPALVAERAQVVAGTEVSAAAQQALLRAGWTDLGTLRQWVRPVRPRPLLTERVGALAARVVSVPAGIALRAYGELHAALHRSVRLVPLTDFDSRADDVWARCAAAWPVITLRDRSWLTWRWDACPRRDGLAAFWLERSGQMVGWVVTRTRAHRGNQAAFVVDFLCLPEELPALFALVVAELGRRPITAVYCLARAPGLDRALTLSGFLPRDSGLATMVNASNAPPPLRARLEDPAQWFLTAADSDLDRPREHTQFA